MDDQNVHNFWGISPAVDLLSLRKNSTLDNSVSILQVCPADCRHTISTLAGLLSEECMHCVGDVSVCIYESTPEGIARHVLLICILLDEEFSAEERVDVFLELYGNKSLTATTFRYLGQLGRKLENSVLNSCKRSSSSPSVLTTRTDHLFDFSRLSFRERDEIAEVFRSYASEDLFDMDRAWDLRCRHYYKDHYDHRTNQMDWDYWMKLCKRNADDKTEPTRNIIHRREFLNWRTSGIAFKLDTDKDALQPNRSLISKAVGRTKEYKNRHGKDIGRKVIASGYWGDIVNSPYHCFGTASKEKTLFEVANKEFKHSATEVTKFNLTRLKKRLESLLSTLPEPELDSPECKTHGNGGMLPVEKHNKDPQETAKNSRHHRLHIIFQTGNLDKMMQKNKTVRKPFDVVFLSWHCTQEIKLITNSGAAAKGSILICESVNGLLDIPKDKAEQFRKATKSSANKNNWKDSTEIFQLLPAVSEYFLCFEKDLDASTIV